MTAWFQNGLLVLHGDERLRAIKALDGEDFYLLSEAIEILRDQAGDDVPVAEAIWAGELPCVFLGRRTPIRLNHSKDDYPGSSVVRKHIAVSGIELNKWIQDKHSWVNYRFPDTTGQAEKPKAVAIEPLQRFAAQDAIILATIASLGLNPLALPKNPPGKAGVKADVRKALNTDKMFTGSTVFDKAWERLSANGDIVIID